MLVGVDEAGRGPVLGSMYIAAVGVPSRDLLPDGIDDSKRLSSLQRQKLARTLAETEGIDTAVQEVPVSVIDEPATTLTTVTIEAVQSVIQTITGDEDGNVTCVLDAADVNEERYARRVSQGMPASYAITANHGADGDDPVVGAASIIAKEHREQHVASLTSTYGEVGSGYPSDPVTRTFLASYLEQQGELPPCARLSWKTCRDVLDEAAQGSLDDFV